MPTPPLARPPRPATPPHPSGICHVRAQRWSPPGRLGGRGGADQPGGQVRGAQVRQQLPSIGRARAHLSPRTQATIRFRWCSREARPRRCGTSMGQSASLRPQCDHARCPPPSPVRAPVLRLSPEPGLERGPPRRWRAPVVHWKSKGRGSEGLVPGTRHHPTTIIRSLRRARPRPVALGFCSGHPQWGAVAGTPVLHPSAPLARRWQPRARPPTRGALQVL